MELLLCHYRAQPGYALWERVDRGDGTPGLLWRDYTTADDLADARRDLGLDDADLKPGDMTPTTLALAVYDTVWIVGGDGEPWG